LPVEAKPLFRPDALRTKLAAFVLPTAAATARQKLANWTDLLSTKAAEKMKETELLGDFIRDVFVDLLGNVGPASGLPVYTLKRESLVQVDGKFADAALGRFTLTDAKSEFIVVIEGKGPRDPLDRPFGSRKRSAVEQALQYAVNLQIDWFHVTNMREIRLFHKGLDPFTYERFETAKLANDDAALKRFTFLLGAERVVPAAGPTHLDAIVADNPLLQAIVAFWSGSVGLVQTRWAAAREFFKIIATHQACWPDSCFIPGFLLMALDV